MVLRARDRPLGVILSDFPLRHHAARRCGATAVPRASQRPKLKEIHLVGPSRLRFNPVSLVCEGVGKSKSLKVLPPASIGWLFPCLSVAFRVVDGQICMRSWLLRSLLTSKRLRSMEPVRDVHFTALRKLAGCQLNFDEDQSVALESFTGSMDGRFLVR